MNKPLGLAIAAVGAVLLILGIIATDSFSSNVSEFFTGNPSDKAVWLMLGGVAAIVGGLVMAGMSRKSLRS